MSKSCDSLALWLSYSAHEMDAPEVRLVYPQTGVRHPPEEGLEPWEIKLYEEAAID